MRIVPGLNGTAPYRAKPGKCYYEYVILGKQCLRTALHKAVFEAACAASAYLSSVLLLAQVLSSWN